MSYPQPLDGHSLDEHGASSGKSFCGAEFVIQDTTVQKSHPYPRYSASLVEERFMVDDVGDHDDEESLLDLSILYEAVPQMHDALGDPHLAQNPEDQVGERRDEPREATLVIVDPDIIIGDLREEQEVERDNVERPRQPSPFLRLDMTKSVILENM
ncbi:hypothetical protein APHAL10511_003866 [Amanita phalloides]|nr:hypothetical protein APHAL10511_003866 [Amanita phalloides]